MRQNRNGHTSVIKYKGYDIKVRKGVRNDSDASYSIIITRPIGNDCCLIKKRYANIKTKEKELITIDKAKNFIDNL